MFNNKKKEINEIENEARKIIKVAIIIEIIIFILLVLIFYKNIFISISWLIGSTASIINFIILKNFFVNFDKNKEIFDKKKLYLNYLIRYSIYIVIILAALIEKDKINVYTIFVGFFIIKISIIISWAIRDRR